MSLAGIEVYKRNVEIMQGCAGYRNASDAQKVEIMYRLLRSKYGLGSFFGKVHPLPEPPKKRPDSRRAVEGWEG